MERWRTDAGSFSRQRVLFGLGLSPEGFEASGKYLLKRGYR